MNYLNKSNIILAWVIFLSMLIISCTGNKVYDKLLTTADSLMDVDDDSARVAIQMLDEVKPKKNACKNLWKFW